MATARQRQKVRVEAGEIVLYAFRRTTGGRPSFEWRRPAVDGDEKGREAPVTVEELLEEADSADTVRAMILRALRELPPPARRKGLDAEEEDLARRRVEREARGR